MPGFLVFTTENNIDANRAQGKIGWCWTTGKERSDDVRTRERKDQMMLEDGKGKKRKGKIQGQRVVEIIRINTRIDEWDDAKNKEENKMTDDINDKNPDEDSLLLLLRDAIVQHSSLNDIKLILRYFQTFFFYRNNYFNIFLSVVNM